MCGICGIANERNEAVLQAMTRTMVHRGPNDEGFYLSDGICLGVRRLSIIDVEGGHQPIHSEDRQVWVICNGEIYNYKELRDFLQKKGHQFYTHTDTEVIVHAYEEYQEACIHLFRGMFALAIWDARRRSLFLARDRLGEKPLYYWWGNGRLVFGSEIKAILQHPDVPRRMDLEALQLYLSFGYVPAPWTMFAGIRKLPSGHYLICDQDGVKVKPYWDVTFPDEPRRVSVHDAVDELRLRLQEVVRLRLVADVQLAALLSGGIDSSTVVALMSRMSTTPVKTFTVGFGGPGWYNEFNKARPVVLRYQTEHHEVILSAPEVPKLLPKIIWHLDEPVADAAALPTYLICSFLSRHATVLLTGEGGDEMFGGYPRYHWFRLAKRLEGWLPSGTRSAMLATMKMLPFGHTTRHRAQLLLEDFSDEQRHLMWVGTVLSGGRVFNALPSQLFTTPEQLVSEYLNYGPPNSMVDRLMYLDMKTWLVDDILVKMDKLSMASSVEARAPFVDHRLVEFLATLPEELKVKGRHTKWLFKKAVEDWVPQSTIRSFKHPFRAPMGLWFRGPLSAYIKEQLLSSQSLAVQYLSRHQIERIVHDHMTGRVNYERALWALLCIELWHRTFIDGEQVA